jgi:hypothetical protein
MAYKIKLKPLKDMNLKKSGDKRTLYKIKSEGMEFWSLIPPIKSEGEVLLDRRVFGVSKLKEGLNDKYYYFSQTDIDAIKQEKKKGA